MVVRAANGLSNSRSTLITGMPASIACCATGVSAAPSKGSSTMASTLSLMKVSTWLIWVLTSLVPSATTRWTSLYLSAAARAAFVMPAIQPWSAAGAEKPMVTVSPDLSLLLLALLPPPLPELSGVFPVQPARRAPTPTAATAMVVRRRYPRCLVADMFSPRSACLAPSPGGRVGPPLSREARRVVLTQEGQVRGSGRDVATAGPGTGRAAGNGAASAGGAGRTAGRSTCLAFGCSGDARPRLPAGQPVLQQDGEDDDDAAGDGL